MRSLTLRTPRLPASSLGAAATTVAALSLVALLAPACAHAEGYNFANVADTTSQIDGFGDPSLNNSGQVAFRAALHGGGFGIFAGNTAGAPPTTVANTFGQFSDFGPLSLNALGQVVFGANLNAGGQGIFASNTAGAAPTTVANSTGPFSGGFGDLSLNDSGQVAFGAIFDTGTVTPDAISGIFASNTAGAAPTTIAITAAPFSDFGSVSLNDSGQVAFDANLDAGGQGIYTSTTTGGPTTRVLGTGDALFGSTVSDIGVGREGLNDSGQIAFAYRLVDGRQGIAVASAAVIPEPGTLALTGLPLAVIAGMAIRRRRRG